MVKQVNITSIEEIPSQGGVFSQWVYKIIKFSNTTIFFVICWLLMPQFVYCSVPFQEKVDIDSFEYKISIIEFERHIDSCIEIMQSKEADSSFALIQSKAGVKLLLLVGNTIYYYGKHFLCQDSISEMLPAKIEKFEYLYYDEGFQRIILDKYGTEIGPRMSLYCSELEIYIPPIYNQKSRFYFKE